jgi:hypothetical protein
MGKPVFIIGDRAMAEELLNVRGRISASRPSNTLVLELYVAFPTHKLDTDGPRQGWAGTNGMWHLPRKENYIRKVASLCGELHLAMPLAHIDH